MAGLKKMIVTSFLTKLFVMLVVDGYMNFVIFSYLSSQSPFMQKENDDDLFSEDDDGGGEDEENIDHNSNQIQMQFSKSDLPSQ